MLEQVFDVCALPHFFQLVSGQIRRWSRMNTAPTSRRRRG